VQQHRFNMPLQLACAELLPGADGPDDADVYELDLAPGDVLVAATDGLFDNMWDRELERLLAAELAVAALPCSALPYPALHHPTLLCTEHVGRGAGEAARPPRSWRWPALPCPVPPYPVR
jgi:hypothetical protein